MKQAIFIHLFLKLTGDLGKRCCAEAECVQQLVCPSVGTGLMNQCNLSQLKLLFPPACSVLSLGASPRAEKSFLYRLALVRLSHLGRVWMAFACRLFLCMKNAWIFPQVLINAIFSYWELQAKNQSVLRLYSNVLLIPNYSDTLLRNIWPTNFSFLAIFLWLHCIFVRGGTFCFHFSLAGCKVGEFIVHFCSQ